LGGSSFQWNFGDGTVLNGENPEHTYQAPGEYTISLTAFDATGACSDQFSITVQVDPVGVTEVAEMKLNLYPNPANEQVTIEAPRALDTIRIYDLTGRTVLVSESIGSPRTTINVAAFTAGVYFVEADGARVRLVVN
jgi:PKD repeat protein